MTSSLRRASAELHIYMAHFNADVRNGVQMVMTERYLLLRFAKAESWTLCLIGDATAEGRVPISAITMTS